MMGRGAQRRTAYTKLDRLTIFRYRLLVNQSLFLVFLKTKVPNGNCLSPRLSKNLSQALRTDKIWRLRRPSNFSTSRFEFESWGPTGLSSANPTRKRYLLFIAIHLYVFMLYFINIIAIKMGASIWINEALAVDPTQLRPVVRIAETFSTALQSNLRTSER
jgi:hypothetical protein